MLLCKCHRLQWGLHTSVIGQNQPHYLLKLKPTICHKAFLQSIINRYQTHRLVVHTRSFWWVKHGNERKWARATFPRPERTFPGSHGHIPRFPSSVIVCFFATTQSVIVSIWSHSINWYKSTASCVCRIIGRLQGGLRFLWLPSGICGCEPYACCSRDGSAGQWYWHLPELFRNRTHSDLMNQKPWSVPDPRFNKPSRQFWFLLKFENHCSKLLSTTKQNKLSSGSHLGKDGKVALGLFVFPFFVCLYFVPQNCITV